MNADPIVALRELEQQATPGPWQADASEPADVVVWTADDPRWIANIGNGQRQTAILAPDVVDPSTESLLRNVFEADTADAALIAAMRNALPALLDVAEAAWRWRTWPAQAIDEHGHDEEGVLGELLAALDRLHAPVGQEDKK
jgi:hypothetical protein